jgi:hypothetical protein
MKLPSFQIGARDMLQKIVVALLATGALTIGSAQLAGATGLATCDSGPPEKWQSQEKLSAMLKEKGWEVRNIKVDGGCYEVYAIDDKGERVEAYFHPLTLERVPIKGQ